MRIDIGAMLKEAIKESIEEHECEDKKKSLLITDEFEKRFGHLGFNFWKLSYKSESNEFKDEYISAYKFSNEWSILGIARWATFNLMQNAPILKEYEGIESYLNELGDTWLCLLEKDDGLIILSNYPNRSGLIKAV